MVSNQKEKENKARGAWKCALMIVNIRVFIHFSRETIKKSTQI